MSRDERDRVIRVANTLWPDGTLDDDGFARWVHFLVRRGVPLPAYQDYVRRTEFQLLPTVARFFFALGATNLIARAVSWLVTYLGIFS